MTERLHLVESLRQARPSGAFSCCLREQRQVAVWLVLGPARLTHQAPRMKLQTHRWEAAAPGCLASPFCHSGWEPGCQQDCPSGRSEQAAASFACPIWGFRCGSSPVTHRHGVPAWALSLSTRVILTLLTNMPVVSGILLTWSRLRKTTFPNKVTVADAKVRRT